MDEVERLWTRRCRAALAGVVLLGATACDGPGGDPAPAPDPALDPTPAAPPQAGPPEHPPFEFVAEAFSGASGAARPFDAVVADMDLDGDPDLLVNRHHLVHAELFENVGGRFELVNVRGADRSGLFDNPGIPDLFADESEMLERIRAGVPGLYLWHDSDREGFWRFHFKCAKPTTGVELTVQTNRPIEESSWFDAAGAQRRGDDGVRIALDAHANETLGVRVQWIATQLIAALHVPDGGVRPAVFAGRGAVRVDPAREPLTLWKPDPHGIAWVQAVGSPQPDVFIARGSLRGKLAPPKDPKTNRFYIWQGVDAALYRRVHAGIIPGDYARGRQVAWVDVDGDGANELYVGNFRSPNALLVRDPETGRYRDRATEFGLAFSAGESFAWVDLDDDGLDDLVFVSGDDLRIARNRGGVRFERAKGRDVGLELPEPRQARSGAARIGLIERPVLHVFDFDADGRLDLWVSGHGGELTNHLFLRRAAGFVDVTRRAGLSEIAGTRALAVLDVNGDGRMDAVSAGERLVLLRNLGGARFGARRLDSPEDEIAAACACDADGDGRTDLVLIGERRHLALNTTGGEAALRVEIDAIGAVVRAYYGDGRTQAQRYGSSANTGFSQGQLPLRFGVPSPGALAAIGVRRPGSTEEIRHAIEPGQRTLRVGR